MTSTLILRTATRPLTALLIFFALFMLLRGHDSPGGGFIGGLIAGAAFSLYAMALGVPEARRALRVDPRYLIAGGLALGVAAGLYGLTQDAAFLTHTFLEQKIPFMGGISLSTTLLFDLGVFFTVAGMVLMVLFRLMEVES